MSISGKALVFTGTLVMKRNDAKAAAEAAGATVGSSVTAKTDILVCGTGVGEKKTADAEKKGVAVWNEDEFAAAIGAGAGAGAGGKAKKAKAPAGEPAAKKKKAAAAVPIGFGKANSTPFQESRKELTAAQMKGYKYGKASKKPAAGKLDLVFLLDTTGSMGSVLRACQDSIVSLAETIAAQEAQDIQFALIPYRDHMQTEQYCTQLFPFTRDLNQMLQNVNSLNVGGGGDAPEAVTAALFEAVCLDWREDAAKMVVIMADAGPHGLGEGHCYPGGDPDGKDPLAIAKEMESLGIVVYSVIAGGGMVTDKTKHFFCGLSDGTGGVCMMLDNVAVLGDAILAGARESVDMELNMADVRKKMTALEKKKGRALTDMEAETEAAKLMNATAPRSIPQDKVVSIPADRLAAFKEASDILDLCKRWDQGGAAGPAKAGGKKAAVAAPKTSAARVSKMARAREARSTDKVLIECVQEGSKVRAKVVSEGYADKNCQVRKQLSILSNDDDLSAHVQIAFLTLSFVLVVSRPCSLRLLVSIVSFKDPHRRKEVLGGDCGGRRLVLSCQR
jgi:Mg-chelatase subunit ChlD